MNLELYNKVRAVPQEAKKEIAAGRLKGKTDINPMWRIKTLTDQFGPCGIGWYTEIAWTHREDSSSESVIIVQINLYIKHNNEWSKPIVGVGGSMLCALESKGPYVSDECYKMAYTDAISVACKALGIGADVYWDKDSSKYAKPEKKPVEEQTSDELFDDLGSRAHQIDELIAGTDKTIADINKALNNMKEGANIDNIPEDTFQRLLIKLGKKNESISD